MQGRKQLDPPPVSSRVVDKNGYLTPVWLQWHNTQKPVLEATVSQYRLSLPNVTTEERDKIPNTQNGDKIYNKTLDKEQVYEAGSWKTVTTT